MKTIDLHTTDALRISTLARIARVLNLDPMTVRKRMKPGGTLERIIRRDTDGCWFARTEELRAYALKHGRKSSSKRRKTA